MIEAIKKSRRDLRYCGEIKAPSHGIGSSSRLIGTKNAAITGQGAGGMTRMAMSTNQSRSTGVISLSKHMASCMELACSSASR